MAQAMGSEDPDQHSCPYCGQQMPEPDRRGLDEILASMTMDNPQFRARVQASQASHEAQMRHTGRIPRIEDYRKVYEVLHRRDGIAMPSDEEICRVHLVAP